MVDACGCRQRMTEIRRGVSARALIKALRREGFHLVRTRGSHRIYRHLDGRRVVVAYHRMGDAFPMRTLKAMIRDAGWTEEDLRRLGINAE